MESGKYVVAALDSVRPQPAQLRMGGSDQLHRQQHPGQGGLVGERDEHLPGHAASGQAEQGPAADSVAVQFVQATGCPGDHVLVGQPVPGGDVVQDRYGRSALRVRWEGPALRSEEAVGRDGHAGWEVVDQVGEDSQVGLAKRIGDELVLAGLAAVWPVQADQARLGAERLMPGPAQIGGLGPGVVDMLRQAGLDGDASLRRVERGQHGGHARAGPGVGAPGGLDRLDGERVASQGGPTRTRGRPRAVPRRPRSRRGMAHGRSAGI